MQKKREDTNQNTKSVAEENLVSGLVNDFVNNGLIDTINDQQQQTKLSRLGEGEQKNVAQNIVVQWITENREANELLSVKRVIQDIPDSKHQKELSGFNGFLMQAVNLYAAFNGLCDKRNPYPERMLKELTPTHIDHLNDMPELKTCLFKYRVIPCIDNIVFKIQDPKDRAELSQKFRSQPEISGIIGTACEVKDLVEKLKGDTPWKMFDERGLNVDTFVGHADLVNSLISEKEAEKIGTCLQSAPKEKVGKISTWLHNLNEGFKGLNRINGTTNIFTIMGCAMAANKPSIEDNRKMAGSLTKNTLFQANDSVQSNNDSTTQYTL